MSSFGINLDLQLRGESGLKRAVRVAGDLEKIFNRINDKGLDLSAIGGSRKAGDLADFKNKFNALAKDIAAGKKKFGETEVSIRRYRDAFTQLAANTKAGTSSFNEFTAAIAQLDQELDKIAKASENARRAQLGLLSVEEEAAELAAKREQAKAKEEEAAARKKNADAAKKEEKRLEKLNKQRDREANLKKRQRGRAIGDLAASVGFPMLFGGGIGSIAGGAAGSIAGSMLGVGFGGQILGSAIGQALDQAAQGANQFALEVTKASTSLDTLVEAIGLRGTSTAQSFKFAETLGIGGAARQAAQGSLEQVIGKDGIEKIEKLGKSSEDASNAINRFGASTSSFFAPLLTGINQFTTAIFGGVSALEKLERAEEALEAEGDLSQVSGSRRRGAAARRNRLTTQIETLQGSPEVAAQLKLEEQIKKVVSDRINLAEQETALEESRLTSRRDVFAVDQGNLAIQAQQNKLDVLAIQLAGDLTEEKRRELKLEEDLTEEAKRQAEAAKENARIEAQRQIQREQMSGAVKQIGMLRQEQEMDLKFRQMEQGRFKFFEEEARSLENKLNITEMTLEIEQKRDLIGVNEAERVASINRDYELRKRLAKEQYYLELQSLEQAHAAYKLSRLQVDQEIKMQNLQAKISADQQIRQTSPFARETELMDPFFGASRQLEVDQAAAYNEQLSIMEKQLSDVSEQLNIVALDPKVRQGLEDQERQIKNQIANFKEYQPAIDEAALAQARFTEAMAITVPVTDALFDNLLAVVEGTKTAEQAFADFLRSIASMLMDAAKQMIATYIAIGIAKAFAGMGSSTSSSGEAASKAGTIPSLAPSLQGGTLNDPKKLFTPATLISGKALGGAVGAGQPYLVGEKGPELFVPGAQGNIVPNNAMGGSNIVVNVDASGSSVEGNAQQSKALGKAIGAAVQAEIVKQKMPGGLLN